MVISNKTCTHCGETCVAEKWMHWLLGCMTACPPYGKLVYLGLGWVVELLGFMVIDTKTAHIVEKRVLLGALMGCGVAWLHGHCEQDCAHCGET